MPPTKPKPSKKNIPLTQITIDSSIQQRIKINHDTVDNYAIEMRQGANFPPLILFHDGSNYYLADGFHRYRAYKKNKIQKIPCEIYSGTIRDAVLYAVGANSDHGLPRTHSDKRYAVMTLLHDEEWKQWSDHEIARQCRVTQPFVSKFRASLTNNNYQSDYRKCADGRIINTSNIGNKKLNGKVSTPENSTSKHTHTNHRLFIGNCEKMPEIHDECAKRSWRRQAGQSSPCKG